MRQLLCATMLLAVPILARPAPIPREREAAVPYFPTRKGDRSVFEHESGDVVHVVTEVGEKDGAKIVTLGREIETGVLTEMTVSVSAKGLYQRPDPCFEAAEPLCLLKLPAKVGDRWDVKTPSANGNLEGRVTVAAIEKIEVPAGTFTAVRVEWDYSLGGKPQKRTHWYAPEVGLIQAQMTNKSMMKLKSFTKGEKR